MCAALLAACNRPGTSEAAPRDAAKASCALPEEHFASDRRELVGSRLGVPYNLLQVGGAGELLWNGAIVGPLRVEEYLQAATRLQKPVLLVIQAAADSPCAAVRDALSVALRLGQCRADRCVFEQPGTGLPSPPVIPDRASLLGKWRVASIDGVAPPPGAPPVMVNFTDDAVRAQSQCITYNWLVQVEDGRLKLRTPPGPVAMCARAPSSWEKSFGDIMAAAAWIESSGDEIVVTGTKGTLRLHRPHAYKA